MINEKRIITRKLANKYLDKMISIYPNGNNIQKSLLKLLGVFLDKMFDEYKQFSVDEKIGLIRETLENKALRQNMDKIDENVILSTIHASKGLEFSNVIIADNEECNIPAYYTCKDCNKINKDSYCVKKIKSSNENSFLEELSVFYVGFTRAKDKIYFTLSKKDAQNYRKTASCFLKFKGIGKNNMIKIATTD